MSSESVSSPCLLLGCVVGVLFWPATAAADPAYTNVWWEWDSNVPVPSGWEMGPQGQGKALEIGVPVGTEYPDFHLVMKMSNEATVGTDGMTGWATNLWRGPDLTMTITNPTTGDPYGDEATIGLLNPLDWNTSLRWGWINDDYMLLNNYGRARGGTDETPLSQVNSPLTFVRFTMLLDVPAITPGEHHSVYQSVGAALFSCRPATRNYVSFGPNPEVSGLMAVMTWSMVSQETCPVIKILAIPEPAALTFFGASLCMLPRRTKR